MELEESTCLTLDYTTKPQSLPSLISNCLGLLIETQASLVAQRKVKRSAGYAGDAGLWVLPLDQKDPLEEEMATNSSILESSVLGNPMDRRTWQVQRVAKCQT